MRIRVDPAAIPPTVVLEDVDDQKSLAVSIEQPDHCFVDPGELLRLAGARADDRDWRSGFDAMVDYAREHGWVREDGAIRAHVERS